VQPRCSGNTLMRNGGNTSFTLETSEWRYRLKECYFCIIFLSLMGGRPDVIRGENMTTVAGFLFMLNLLLHIFHFVFYLGIQKNYIKNTGINFKYPNC
jgi:hypothetical protein